MFTTRFTLCKKDTWHIQCNVISHDCTFIITFLINLTGLFLSFKYHVPGNIFSHKRKHVLYYRSMDGEVEADPIVWFAYYDALKVLEFALISENEINSVVVFDLEILVPLLGNRAEYDGHACPVGYIGGTHGHSVEYKVRKSLTTLIRIM